MRQQLQSPSLQLPEHRWVLQKLTMGLEEEVKLFRKVSQDKSTYIEMELLQPPSPSLDQDTDTIMADEILLRQRDGDSEQVITDIAKSVQEIASLFQEISQLVNEQGTILDRIDYNIENTLENVKKGNVQLRKADQHSKSSKTVYIISCLLIIVIILIIVISLKYNH